MRVRKRGRRKKRMMRMHRRKETSVMKAPTRLTNQMRRWAQSLRKTCPRSLAVTIQGPREPRLWNVEFRLFVKSTRS
jgi:hypothetical protein